jgi:hypothetical protein
VVLPFQCDAEKLEEWVCNSIGRVLALQAGSCVFDSRQIHVTAQLDNTNVRRELAYRARENRTYGSFV